MNAGTARSARVGPSHRGRADLGRILGVTRAEATVRAGSVGIVRTIAATTTEAIRGRTPEATKANATAATKANAEMATAMAVKERGQDSATADRKPRPRLRIALGEASRRSPRHARRTPAGGASPSMELSARRLVNAMMRSKRQRTSDSTPKNGSSSKSAKPSVMPKLLVKMTCGPKPSVRSIGVPWSPTNGTLPERNR